MHYVECISVDSTGISIYLYTCTIYTDTVYQMHFRSFTYMLYLTTDKLSLYHLTSALLSVYVYTKQKLDGTGWICQYWGELRYNR